MYCPRCGQQQVSDEMRFCSRCGLALSGLPQWIAGGGTPYARGAETQVSLSSPRRKGIRRAAKLMFFSGVLFAVFLVIGLAFDEGSVMIIPIFIFFVALIMMLYARLFSDPTSAIKNQQVPTSGLGAMSQGSALPPASNIPMHGPGNLGRRQVRTAELAQPPSVTEHTTKLLDND